MRRLMLGSFSNCIESEKEGLEVLKEWRPVYGLLDGAKIWPWSVWQQLFTFVTISVVRCFSLLFPLLRPSSNASFFGIYVCVFPNVPPIISTLNLSVCDLKTWFVAVWALHILLKIQARSTRLYSITTSNEDSETKNSKLSSFDTKSQIWTFSPLIL